MSKFRKRPVVIEAVQLKWGNWSEVCEHAVVGRLEDGQPQGCYIDENGAPLPGCYIDENGAPLPESRTSNEIGLLIPTLEGLMVAREDDWIIRGIAGELYPCKPDIFEATYEPC